MRRQIFCGLAAVLMISLLVLFWPASAARAEGKYGRVIDLAEQLTDEEQQFLASRLDEISYKYQVDVSVMVDNDPEITDAVSFADDFYDYMGYGLGDNDDGMLLYFNLAERDYAFSAHAKGSEIFTDDIMRYMISKMKSDLAGDRFYAAFVTYADLAEEILETNAMGKTFRLPRPKLSSSWFFLAPFAGFILTALIMKSLKKPLKSVGFVSGAQNYALMDTLNLTSANDRYLSTSVSRTRRESSSSSSGGSSSSRTSSSGRSHTGVSGKF